jgi:GNAT superfamily N-acetyltransferase
MTDTIAPLDDSHVEQAVHVLSNAFAAYPVMRFVIGADAPDYPVRLRAMMNFFVMARMYRGENMVGVLDGGSLLAAALVSRPGHSVSPPELDQLRLALWDELGAAARRRYEMYQSACEPFAMEAPHLHVNVIGVLDQQRGRGLGRRLMEHIHRMSRDEPSSAGVSLTTEDPANVLFYQNLGYSLVGHNRVSDDLETWGFFRPN